MVKIDGNLRAKVQQHPDEPVRLIVRVDGDLSEAARRLAARGAKAAKTLKLINAVVVTCRGKDVSALAQEPFVRSVEEDHKVRTQ